MRTLLRASWVVGWDAEARQHEVWHDGACLLQDDRVVAVGPRQSAGPEADRTLDLPGRLITPGLVTTHVHAGLNVGDLVFRDPGRPWALGRNYLNWQALVRGRQRYQPDVRTDVLFGLAACVRAGATTIVEVGAAGQPEHFVDLVEELGSRVYTGLSYRNAVMYSLPDGRIDYDWDDARGVAGLERALRFAEQQDGAANGRIRAILCPGHPDTCSAEVVARTATEAHARNLPVTVHAAINATEMERTLDLHGCTPIQLLERCGLLELGPRAILGHGVFLSGHSWTRYVDAPDLRLLGQHGTSVSYSPLKYLHMGVLMESPRRYLQAGVNLTVGTDFSPNDALAEMRYAMLASRVADRSYLSGTPREVFDAATINAATALGRDDLGRLAPGAKADVVVWDLRRLHFGAVYDPVTTLVENGWGADAEQVYVDGHAVVYDGRLVAIDEEALLRDVQREGERLFADVPAWSWGGRPMEAMAPPAYPLRHPQD